MSVYKCLHSFKFKRKNLNSLSSINLIMENILDNNLPLIFDIMIKLSKKRFGFTIKNRFGTMSELYKVLKGKHGRKEDIISDLKEVGVIGQDEKGIYYDTKKGARLIRESTLIRLLNNHDIGILR